MVCEVAGHSYPVVVPSDTLDRLLGSIVTRREVIVALPQYFSIRALVLQVGVFRRCELASNDTEPLQT